MTDPALNGLARALIAHCSHRLGLSERWACDASASWRIVRVPCQGCGVLAEALGLELESGPAAVPARASSAG